MYWSSICCSFFSSPILVSKHTWGEEHERHSQNAFELYQGALFKVPPAPDGDYVLGPEPKNFLKIGVFPLKLPENCMISKKILEARGAGPQAPRPPLYPLLDIFGCNLPFPTPRSPNPFGLQKCHSVWWPEACSGFFPGFLGSVSNTQVFSDSVKRVGFATWRFDHCPVAARATASGRVLITNTIPAEIWTQETGPAYSKQFFLQALFFLDLWQYKHGLTIPKSHTQCI